MILSHKISKATIFQQKEVGEIRLVILNWWDFVPLGDTVQCFKTFLVVITHVCVCVCVCVHKRAPLVALGHPATHKMIPTTKSHAG